MRGRKGKGERGKARWCRLRRRPWPVGHARAEIARCTRSAGANCGQRSRAVVVAWWRGSRRRAWGRPGVVRHRTGDVTARVWQRGSGFYGE
jgi:hypothetical protein